MAEILPGDESDKSLKKSLGLFDVYVISTGAMFSSGFFLLPGIAAAQTGPSVILAYFVAGLLIMPAMLSTAELSTAMPKAGGSYYFVDRALGPLMGTVGGLGTWLSLVFKTAFALIGMGAYLAIYVELPIKPLAIGLTVAFTALNIMGAKETSGLQRLLVTVLLAVLAYFIAQGLFFVFDSKGATAILTEFDPFFTHGLEGFLATVGLVFVSYAGLTKVASVAEEVQDPDRAIPLGMLLSVLTATFVYCVGVFIMVAVLDPVAFRDDMTPVATAADAFFSWLPAGIGVGLAVAAAIAAFASTGNAGIMSASRYPLAMGRDKLLPDFFTKISRFSTPATGIAATAALMIATIVFADVATVAKLGSAFQLLIFGLLNFCVIVMRESRLEYYHPGFKSPLYPWVQIAGVFIPVLLISQMGWLPAVLSVGIIFMCVGWYYGYARKRTDRFGAVHHVFERLGRLRDDSVDRELRTIIGEKGLREEDQYEEVITLSKVLDYSEPMTFEEIVREVSSVIAEAGSIDADDLADGFLTESNTGLMPLAHGVAAPNMRHHDIDIPMMVLVRSREGVDIDLSQSYGHLELDEPLHAFIFLVSPDDQFGPHLRSVAQVATSVDAPDFMERWMECKSPGEMRRLLLRDERFCQIDIEREGPTSDLIGAGLADLAFPPGALIAIVHRGRHSFIPTSAFRAEVDDHLTIIGNPDAMDELRERFEPDDSDDSDEEATD